MRADLVLAVEDSCVGLDLGRVKAGLMSWVSVIWWIIQLLLMCICSS